MRDRGAGEAQETHVNDTRAKDLFDPQKGLPTRDREVPGDVASGNETERPAAPVGDSPTHGTVPGPLAPEPAPDTEVRPHPEND